MNSHGDKLEMEKTRAAAAAVATETKTKNGESAETGSEDKTEEKPEKRAAQLEHEIEEIRDNLGGLVSELDHRRHRLNPLNAVSRYPWPFALGGVAVAGLVVGGVLLRNSRARDRDRLVNRGKRLQAALRRAMDKPDKVAKAEPNIGMKVLTTMATAVAAVAARRLATRLFARDS